MDDSILRLWRHSELGYAQKLSAGRSGGMLLFWNKEVFNSEQILSGENYLGVLGQWKGKSSKYLLFNVYGPQLISQKRAMWSVLSNLMTNFRGVCVIGDFNAVRRPSERCGSRFKPITTGDFNSFLLDTELIEVKQGGRRFTWVSWDGLKMSKLDRFLINRDFASEWEGATAVVGERVFSDHCPE